MVTSPRLLRMLCKAFSRSVGAMSYWISASCLAAHLSSGSNITKNFHQIIKFQKFKSWHVAGRRVSEIFWRVVEKLKKTPCLTMWLPNLVIAFGMQSVFCKLNYIQTISCRYWNWFFAFAWPLLLDPFCLAFAWISFSCENFWSVGSALAHPSIV